MDRKSNVACAENILICGTSRKIFVWIGAWAMALPMMGVR